MAQQGYNRTVASTADYLCLPCPCPPAEQPTTATSYSKNSQRFREVSERAILKKNFFQCDSDRRDLILGLLYPRRPHTHPECICTRIANTSPKHSVTLNPPH